MMVITVANKRRGFEEAMFFFDGEGLHDWHPLGPQGEPDIVPPSLDNLLCEVEDALWRYRIYKEQD